MPRAKKTTAKTFEKNEVRNAFVSCRQITCDNIATAIAEMAHKETLTREQAAAMTAVLQAVASDSIALVMSNKGF